MSLSYDPLDLLGRGSPPPLVKPRNKLDALVKSRSTTPSIPPGLGASEFPPLAPSKAVEEMEPVSKSATPATPERSTEPSMTNKGKQKEIPAQVKKIQKEASRPSSRSSSVSKAGESTRQTAGERSAIDGTGSPVKKGSPIKTGQAVAVKTETGPTSATEDKAEKAASERRQKPGKLDIAAAQDAAKQEFKPDEQLIDNDNGALAGKLKGKDKDLIDTTPSTVATPATTADTPASSAPAKAPRTLRVIDTPKVESPIKLPAAKAPAAESTPASFSGPATKAPSRRPSVGSINIPSTPSNDVHSETASYTESHPESPAGGKQSLPSRQKTRSMAKKERRARKTEESKLSESVSVDIAEPEVVQEAIIGRKKKAKKDKPAPVKAPTKVNESSREEPQAEKPVKAEPETIEETSARPSPARTPAEPEPAQQQSAAQQRAQRPLSVKERVDSLNFADLLQSFTSESAFGDKVAEFLMSPPGWKTAANASRTSIAPLGDKDLATLDSGTPVLVPSEVDEIDPSSHPYPWSLVLPNPPRTILPMATRAEGELYLSLFNSIIAHPSALFKPDGAPDTDLLLMFLKKGTADGLMSMPSLWDIYPESNGRTSAQAGDGAARTHTSGRRGDRVNEMLRNDNAVLKWMEENVRELEQVEEQIGGNYFARRRAAALGHGPVSLDSVAAAPTPMSGGNGNGSNAVPSTGRQTSSNTRKQVTSPRAADIDATSRALWTALSLPLKNRDVQAEILSLPGTTEMEQRMLKSDEFVALCKREAESLEKKLMGLVRKNNKTLRRAGAGAAMGTAKTGK